MESDREDLTSQQVGDVKERDNIYVVELELTDFKKEDIKVCFNNGYLVIIAENEVVAEKEIRQAFYIGTEVAEENIRAAFHNGTLKCMIPKGEKKDGTGPIEVEIM